ncbi:MAG TPA: hypothetical protein VLJ42_12870 [Solirubrobacteraceae bacterium]|nr:hypothetical protein [Solirubrobacteraceae bacterium]
MTACHAGRASLIGSLALLGLGLGLAPTSAAAAHQTAPSCVPSKLNQSAALAGGRVTVSPGPGTSDASGASQISLLGVPAGELASVAVKGSHSGAHPGRLVAYSQGNGASFLPRRRFNAGELVTGRAVLSQAGQTTPFTWSFRVAVPDTEHAASPGTRPRAPKTGDLQSFASRPDLRPPSATVTTQLPGAAPGKLFLAPYSGPGQYGPMILDESGRLV